MGERDEGVAGGGVDAVAPPTGTTSGTSSASSAASTSNGKSILVDSWTPSRSRSIPAETRHDA
ncbi:hypothetical protein ACFQLZ_04705 [Halospeciosus flavus]